MTPMQGTGGAAVAIRDASDGDADGLISLIGSCWSEYPGCVLDVDREMGHLRRIASTYDERGGRAYVAEEDGGIVGSVGWSPSPATPPGGLELQMLYVRAAARRRGLGRRLVSVVEEEAARRSAPFVELWSDTRFTTAHRLYEQLGYVRTGASRDLQDLSRSIELHFRKDLAAPER
jgi:putative acetyltransferase